MKSKVLLGASLLGLSSAFLPAAATTQAAAYTANFQVAITYQNVGSSAANVAINFYAENNATPISFTPAGGALAPNAGTSVAVGTVQGLGSGGFKGSAVLSADQPVVATIVQYDLTPGGVKNRPVSNGFSGADGAATQLVATVLKDRFGYRTIFSVQNADTETNDINVKVFAVGQAAPVVDKTYTGLPAGAARYFDVGQGDLASLPADFNGSAVVTSTKAGGAAGKIVITANELSTTGNGSSAFEGSSQSGAKIFMPSAFCNNNGTAGKVGAFFSSYAVQNASTTAGQTAGFRVVYKNELGGADIVDPATGVYTLQPGEKKSIIACTGQGGVLPAGFKGSAVIERTEGTGGLVGVGKIQGNNNTTAFLGALDGTGSSKIALPYVRWSPTAAFNTGDRQRVSIAIQNIGSTPATNVRVEYRDRDGVLKGTHTLGTIEAGFKQASNPTQAAGTLDSCGRFGEYGGGANCLGTSFGAGAIVLADSGQLAVVARVQNGNLGGEDYTGTNVP